MGWQWWKTFVFGPLHTTLSSRGIGWNIGTSFLRFGVGPSGARYVIVRIPGTGIGFIKYLGRALQRPALGTVVNPVASQPPPAQALPRTVPLTRNQQILDAIKNRSA
jgi:Protein of unknown function (DUF4236)